MIATSLIKNGLDTEFQRSHEEVFSEPESDISADSDSHPSVRSTASSHEPNDRVLLRYHCEVVSIVDKLFDVSILIRGTSRNFRASRAAVHVERDAEGNDVLPEFKTLVSLKIRGLCPDTPEWLVERLTKVIAMRRLQFYYQKAHRRHMAGIATTLRDETERMPRLRVASRPIEIDFVDPIQEPLMTTSQSHAAPKTVKSGTTMMTYDTIATELVPQEEPGNTGTTIVKLAPSEKRIGENIFPNPPREPQGKAFECTQCFHILSEEIRKVALWRFAFLLCRSNFAPGNTSFPTFNHTPAFPNHVSITISSLRLEKNGSSMRFSSTIMNGGAMPLTANNRHSGCSPPRKISLTIFS